jgi:hypothetical protein
VTVRVLLLASGLVLMSTFVIRAGQLLDTTIGSAMNAKEFHQ